MNEGEPDDTALCTVLAAVFIDGKRAIRAMSRHLKSILPKGDSMHA